MNKNISLTIRTNKPCGEDWDAMHPEEDGRFCNRCQKTVIDFTGFTEKETLDYFIKHPAPVCGRLIHARNNSHFEQPASNTRSKLAPVAATLLALTTLSADAVEKRELTNISFQILPPEQPAVSDSVVITGIIKNDRGEPLENAEISFHQIKTYSDKNGFYTFIIPSALNKPSIIEFSHGGLTREVRNYNPAMGSTSFNITLYAYQAAVTMGIIMPEYHLPDSLSRLSLRSAGRLDAKAKIFLKDLATAMKEHPGMSVTLASYYKTDKTKAARLTAAVKHFLVNEGIDPVRIILKGAEFQKQNPSELVIQFTTDPDQ